MRRGEVWWGNPRLPGGSAKRRPFVLVSNDVFNTNPACLKTLVVHLTTARRMGGPYDWEVPIPRAVAGIPSTSIAKCGEIYTVFKADLSDHCGALPNEYLAKIDSALGIALSLTT